MPGHRVARSDFKNTDVFEKYQCPQCKLLLKDAVQPVCGHWLCKSCADEVLESTCPKCPLPDCQQDLKEEGPCTGAEYFPDRFVRREIEVLIVSCSNRSKGCQWEDRLVKLDDHRSICILGCQYCGEVLPLDQIESHELTCPKALMKCPLAKYGCPTHQQMTREEMRKHISTHSLEHFEMLSDALQLLQKQSMHHIKPVIPQVNDGSNATGRDFGRMSDGAVLSDGPRIATDGDYAGEKVKSKSYRALFSDGRGITTDTSTYDLPDTNALEIQGTTKNSSSVLENSDQKQKDDPLSKSWEFNEQDSRRDPEMGSVQLEPQSPSATACLSDTRSPLEYGIGCTLQRDLSKTKAENTRLENELRHTTKNICHGQERLGSLETSALQLSHSTTALLEAKWNSDMKRKDEEITTLRNSMTRLEKAMRSKHAEFEDRDFRLSLIENSNHDGNMIWKIPQISQRDRDTSIFSLPFYTGRYGYKMCLRLYILGDGIGKNTHMSLFFVIMKGEFDDILQWPFTSKVTFKLINQIGGRDIIDTFQPDPMSSSFQKPKSDMNIACGCPRFASHAELDAFIADDKIVIEISVAD